MRNERPYAEESIWRPIAQDPSKLGLRGAIALNHLQLGDQAGYIDLVLFPRAGSRSSLSRQSAQEMLGRPQTS